VTYLPALLVAIAGLWVARRWRQNQLRRRYGATS